MTPVLMHAPIKPWWRNPKSWLLIALGGDALVRAVTAIPQLSVWWPWLDSERPPAALQQLATFIPIWVYGLAWLATGLGLLVSAIVQPLGRPLGVGPIAGYVAGSIVWACLYASAIGDPGPPITWTSVAAYGFRVMVAAPLLWVATIRPKRREILGAAAPVPPGVKPV